MIEITLTTYELFLAGMYGVFRQAKGVRKKGRYGARKDRSWQINCVGTTGEMAAAKWRNVFYTGNLGNFRAKDVGVFQVRTTQYDDGHLLLHPKDQDDEKFILVLAHRAPTFVLRGWLYAREGKKECWWGEKEEGRPAFYVPQSELRPIETISETTE